MWILLLVVLSASSPPTVGVIQVYPTLQACEQERIRITHEMNLAYPDERESFYLECKPAKKIQA